MSQRGALGFVGVGRMGANIARRLHDAGHQVAAVYDVDRERAVSLAAEIGAIAADAPSGVSALAPIVFTVVSDDAAMRAIFGPGPESLLAFGGGRTFINCATVSPQVHIEIERLAAACGASSLEAAMASSIPQARSGTLYLMVGGDPEAFAAVRPLLEQISAQLRYIGPAGSAATVKALVNMVMNVNTAGLAEGLGMGEALGLDLSMLREVFAATGAASRVLETDGADMQAREHECYFSAAHAAKDSGIALALAAQAGVDVPLAAATKRQYDRMVELGLGELDKSGIAELTFPSRRRAKIT